jgi:hypothetical protein
MELRKRYTDNTFILNLKESELLAITEALGADVGLGNPIAEQFRIMALNILIPIKSN